MSKSKSVVLTFESVDGILKCDYSNESYLAVLSYGTDVNGVLTVVSV